MIASRREIANLTSQLNHDLREPINSIRRKLELLEAIDAKKTSQGEIREYVSGIRSLSGLIITEIKALRNDVISGSFDDNEFERRINSIIQASSRLSTLASRAPDFPKGAKTLTQIRATSLRYQKMLRALLALFSTDEPNFQQTNFSNQAQIASVYVRERFQSQLPAAELESMFFWTSTRASGLADQGMILTIFQNIYENAVKYRNPDRPLKITTSFFELSFNEILKRFSQNFCSIPKADTYALISIEDNGIGIPVESQRRIFDAYVQLPLRREASDTWFSDNREDDDKDIGIGLYTVRKLVASHRGYVLVESDGYNGSTFHVILPQDPRQAMSD